MKFQNSNKGFSLIELMVVIGVIAILAGLVLGIYKIYWEKAKVLVDTLPAARSCMLQLLSYCGEHPLQDIPVSDMQQCQNRTTLFGYTTFNVPSVTCTASGELPDNYTIEANTTASTHYYSKCVFKDKAFRCLLVSGQPGD